MNEITLILFLYCGNPVYILVSAPPRVVLYSRSDVGNIQRFVDEITAVVAPVPVEILELKIEDQTGEKCPRSI